MDAVKTTEWDEALSRLLAFLAALELGGVESRLRIAVRIIDRVRSTQPADPVNATLKCLHREMEQWFAKALDDPAISADRRAALGLVALRLLPPNSDGLETFPLEPPPETLRAAIRNISLRTGPDLALSSMTPRDMDFGAVENLAQETWHQFAWGPLVRAALIWTGIFFATLLAYDHFFPA